MEEFIHEGYYKSVDKKYVDTHRSNKAAIEWWLSKLLFRNDLSRVVYCSPDIAFRKRIEMLDMGKNDDEPIKPESLKLPFASFFQTGEVEPDDRPAAVNAGQAVEGIYHPEVDRNMRSLAVMSKYTITCYFSRQDDLRKAQQLLFWEKEPKSPIWLYTVVTWRGMKICLPNFATIESINTNTNYKESDWLTKNRIFPLEVELTLRSYQLLINNVDKIYQLPIRFSNFIDTFEEDEDNSEYISEEIVLDWAAQKFNLNMDENDVDTNDKEYQLYEKRFVQKEVTVPEEIKSCVKVPNEYTTDIIRGYWQDEESCNLNMYQFDSVKSTPTTAHILLKVKPSDYKFFDHINLLIPTKEVVRVDDCHATEAYFPGLYPNSEYKMTIEVFATDGTIKNYFLSFKTPNSEDNEAPQPEKINKVNGLVGMKF